MTIYHQIRTYIKSIFCEFKQHFQEVFKHHFRLKIQTLFQGFVLAGHQSEVRQLAVVKVCQTWIKKPGIFLVLLSSFLIGEMSALPIQANKLNRKFTNIDEAFGPVADLYVFGGFIQSDLTKFNSTLPTGVKQMNSMTGLAGFGFSSLGKRFMFNSQVGFGFRQRSIFSDYEQVFLGRTNWSFSFGRHLYKSKKNTFIVTPMLGFVYDSYTLNYQNDSIAKPSSINWVIRSQNPFESDEELDDYSNPSFALLGQLKVMTIIKERFTISLLASYQHDIGSGKWHYEYGFRRMSSPDTYSSGLMLNLSFGILIKNEDLEE